jgi:hypothetical protein
VPSVFVGGTPLIYALWQCDMFHFLFCSSLIVVTLALSDVFVLLNKLPINLNVYKCVLLTTHDIETPGNGICTFSVTLLPERSVGDDTWKENVSLYMMGILQCVKWDYNEVLRA